MNGKQSIRKFFHPHSYIDRMYREGKPCGYCHCAKHRGYLSSKLIKLHKCLERDCKWLEKYEKHPYWNQKRACRKR